MKKILFSLLFLMAGIVHAQIQQTFYVSPSSTTSDLEAVRDQVRAVNGNMHGDILVVLKKGKYHLDRTFELTERDGGTNGFNVIWKAESHGKVRMSGGENVTGWTLHDPIKNIYKAYVGNREFRQLYVNGERRTRARTPNTDGSLNLGPYNRTTGVEIGSKKILIDSSEIKKWSNFTDIEMIFYPSWYHERYNLASYTLSGSNAKISFSSSNLKYGFDKPTSWYVNAPYFFENAYEFIDSEGEWYLDRAKDTLYYKPMADENMATAEVTIPMLKTLVSIKGSSATAKASHLVIDGIDFTYSTWNYPTSNGLVLTQAFQPQPISLTNGSMDEAVRPPGALMVQYADSVMVTNNSFSKTGANALVYVIGNTNCDIEGNSFKELSGNAIVIDAFNSSTPDSSQQTKGIKVISNDIKRVGLDYTNSVGILANRVQDLKIESNTLKDLPFTAIQVGNQPLGNTLNTYTNNISISYNDISNFTNIHSDGGGIYTLGAQYKCIIKENYIHDWARPIYESKIAASAGIYLDNRGQFIVRDHNMITGFDPTAPRTYDQILQTTTTDVPTINNPSNDACIAEGAGVKKENKGCKSTCTPPKIPTNVRVNAGILEWDPVENAGGYLVWKGSYGPERYQSYVDVGNNTTYNLNGETGSFAVQAYSSSLSCRSDYSAEPILPLPSFGVGLIEAEDMKLAIGTMESASFYANEKGVSAITTLNDSVKVQMQFSGPNGQYNLKVGYVEESDGQSKYEFRVNGKLIDSWTADLGNTNGFVKQRFISNLALAANDTLEIIGIKSSGASGRIDFLRIQEPNVSGNLKYEAEDMTLVNAKIETLAPYSNGQGAKPNGPSGTIGQASFTFNEKSGIYDVNIGYLEENDGQSSHSLYVNGNLVDTWTANLATNYAEFATHTKRGVILKNGDIIKITGTVNSASAGRMDYVELVPSQITTVRYEAENMTLVNATVETLAPYSNGMGAKPNSPVGTVGQASFTFNGVSGNYDLIVGYLEENDGQATHAVYINGRLADSWTANLGTAYASFATHTTKFVSLNSGDVIKITGTVTGGSFGRMDYVELVPIDASTVRYEAESMTLVNTTVETLAPYSNGKGAKPNSPGGTVGQASFIFNGTNGTYDVTIGYLEENDGQASHALYVNGNLVDSWIANLVTSYAAFAKHTKSGVVLKNGDIIKITGTVTNGSFGRMDYLELNAVQTPAILQANTNTLTLNELKQNSVIIYPNPSKDGKISIKGLDKGYLLWEVFDMNGKKIARGNVNENTTEINLSTQKGVFIIKVTGSMVKPIISKILIN